MTVQHDKEHHRFVVREPEGEGKLVYAPRGPGVIDLLHTEVAPSLRGRGVADLLAKTALDYARESGTKVIVTCPFVRKWLERHPEARDLVVSRPR
jgi:predicted GNAT family acetyltransferase